MAFCSDDLDSAFDMNLFQKTRRVRRAPTYDSHPAPFHPCPTADQADVSAKLRVIRRRGRTDRLTVGRGTTLNAAC